MTPTFSVLIGTIGRPGLTDTLESIRRQRRVKGDQCIVAIDTHTDADRNIERGVTALVKTYGEGFVPVAYNSGYGHLGVEQINHALRTVEITGSHVFTVGDDDVFVDGAYDVLRPICEKYPARAILFKFLAPWRQILWEVPQMQMSRISGCCIAAPYQFVGPMDTRTTWEDGRPYLEHDYCWMQTIIQASGQEPKWVDDVLVIARPEQRGKDVTHEPLVRCWNCRHWRYGEDVPVTDVQCPKCHAVLPVKGSRQVAFA